MPLTPYQEEVARLLSANRSFDSYLAGGAAIHLNPNTRRYSNDLDYFHDSVERVASAFTDDVRQLRAAGHEVAAEIQWLAALSAADAFVRSRPPDEVGCLYYSPGLARFVAPGPDGPADVVPHYGRPGGVLPRVLDDDGAPVVTH